MSTCGLLDYGAGNFGSVRNALDYLGVPVEPVRDAAGMQRADRLILPGVGAFGAAMRRLTALDLIEPLRENVFERQKPFLGICVGMQVLADESDEFGPTPGLGFVPGRVERIPAESYQLRIPHMGWNELSVTPDCPLFRGMTSNPSFYFVHSYAYKPADADDTAATCDYGQAVVACIHRDNIFGVQFHPEKSQHDGLLLLKNFSQL